MLPLSYTAQGEDLDVQLLTDHREFKNAASNDLRIQISKVNDEERYTVGVVDIFPDPKGDVSQIKIPCSNFHQGGQYELEVVGNDINSTFEDQDERLRQRLSVEWPRLKINVSTNHVVTYPEEVVRVRVEFEGVTCTLTDDEKHLPEFWLELYYCGQDDVCNLANVTRFRKIYAEQIRGYPLQKIVDINCNLFGLAGNYMLWFNSSPLVQNYSTHIFPIKVSCIIFNYLFLKMYQTS
jgi:hypothetical protein